MSLSAASVALDSEQLVHPPGDPDECVRARLAVAATTLRPPPAADAEKWPHAVSIVFLKTSLDARLGNGVFDLRRPRQRHPCEHRNHLPRKGQASVLRAQDLAPRCTSEAQALTRTVRARTSGGRGSLSRQTPFLGCPTGTPS